MTKFCSGAIYARIEAIERLLEPSQFLTIRYTFSFDVYTNGNFQTTVTTDWTIKVVSPYSLDYYIVNQGEDEPELWITYTDSPDGETNSRTRDERIYTVSRNPADDTIENVSYFVKNVQEDYVCRSQDPKVFEIEKEFDQIVEVIEDNHILEIYLDNSMIKTFQSDDTCGTPGFTVECQRERCPDGTCCECLDGDYKCCYNGQGVPIKRFRVK